MRVNAWSRKPPCAGRKRGFASHVLHSKEFFMDSYPTDENMMRYVPVNQREVCIVLQ